MLFNAFIKQTGNKCLSIESFKCWNVTNTTLICQVTVCEAYVHDTRLQVCDM
jgi:hypothetical protein